MERSRGGEISRYGFILLLRSGKLCARYVRADLPLLDLQSRAGLNSVLGLGIALAVIGAAALVAVAVIAMRMRRRSRYKRAPVTAAPGCAFAAIKAMGFHGTVLQQAFKQISLDAAASLQETACQ